MNKPSGPPLGFANLPEPLRARIEAELASGERLLWASQPDPKRPRGPRQSRASTWVWVAGWLSLALTCSLALKPVSTSQYAPIGMVVFAIAIINVGMGFLTIVHMLAELAEEGSLKRRLSLSFYALTDRRAVVWEPAPRTVALSVRQYLPDSLKAENIQRFEFADGSGDLVFVWGIYPQNQGFFGVDDIRRVDELVRRVLVEPVSSPAPVQHPDPDDPEEPF